MACVTNYTKIMTTEIYMKTVNGDFMMKLSEIKKLRKFCESLHSEPDWKEVVNELEDDSTDFEVDGVRFIREDVIDDIQQDELSSDECVLGCFAPWLLSDLLDMDVDDVEDIQQSNPEILGRMVLRQDKIAELQAEYVKYDGYGHHFNHYDGSEEEIELNGHLYYVFDNR